MLTVEKPTGMSINLPFELSLDRVQEHPQAGLVPGMRESEYRDFAEDVVKHGVQTPVEVLAQEDGSFILLDGRHRVRAQREAGKTTVPAIRAELRAGETALERMVRTALHRRHLTDDQRAVMATELQRELSKQAMTERAQRGGKAGGRGRVQDSLSGRVPDKQSVSPESGELEPEFPEVASLSVELSFAERMRQARSADEGRDLFSEHENAIHAIEVALGLEASVGQITPTYTRGFSTLTARDRKAMVKRVAAIDAIAGEKIRALVQDGLDMEEPWAILLSAERAEFINGAQTAPMVRNLESSTEIRHLPPAAWQDPTVHHQVRRLCGLIQFVREGADRSAAIKRLNAEMLPSPAKGAAAIDWRTLADQGMFSKKPSGAENAGALCLMIGAFITFHDTATSRRVQLTILEDGCELRCWEVTERSCSDPLLEAWLERTDGPRWTPQGYLPSVKQLLSTREIHAGELAFLLAQEHQVLHSHVRDNVLPALEAEGLIVRDGERQPYRLTESTQKAAQKRDTRREAAEAVNLKPESRKIRQAAELERNAPDLVPKVKDGTLTLREAQREAQARQAQEEQVKREEAVTEVLRAEDCLGRVVTSFKDLKGEAPFDLVLFNPKIPWSHVSRANLDPIRNFLHGASQALVFSGTWTGSLHMAEQLRGIGFEHFTALYWHEVPHPGYPFDSYQDDIQLILWASVSRGPYPKMKQPRSSLLTGPRKNGSEFLPLGHLPQWLLGQLLKQHSEPGQRVLVLSSNAGDEMIACETAGCHFVGVELGGPLEAKYRRQNWQNKLTRCLFPEDQAPESSPAAGAGLAVTPNLTLVIPVGDNPPERPKDERKRSAWYMSWKAWAAARILLEKGELPPSALGCAIARLTGGDGAYERDKNLPELVESGVLEQFGPHKRYRLTEAARAQLAEATRPSGKPTEDNRPTDHLVERYVQLSEKYRGEAFRACERLLRESPLDRKTLVRLLAKELCVNQKDANHRLDHLEQRKLVTRTKDGYRVGDGEA